MSRSGSPALLGARILVVEDEYLLARDIADALRKQGADVVGPAGTSDAAVRLIDSEPLDCVVLDMNLRGDPSADIARRLDERGVGYVVVSGYEPDALPPGVRTRPYLSKPTNPAAVAAAVGDVLKGAAAGGMVPRDGVEPPTLRFSVACSTN